jgi:branched-chain amino acid transport system ATP-binding protein
LLIDQNVRQCVRVSTHVYVLELGRNKVSGSVQDFAQDHTLRDLISQWVDYKIDS